MNFEFYMLTQRENVTETMSVTYTYKQRFIRFMSKQVWLSRFYQQTQFRLFDYKHFRQLLELQNIQSLS